MEKTIEIPEGYEARIEGNKVILEQRESEDERIRKMLIERVRTAEKLNEELREWIIAYLEKQKDEAQKQFNLGVQTGREEVVYEMEKEQKPAEWSEEDKTIIDCAVEVVEKAGLPSLAASLKSLRPQPHWTSLPSNLDEAAKRIAYDVCKQLPNGEEKDGIVYYAILAAIAGAEWVAGQISKAE